MNAITGIGVFVGIVAGVIVQAFSNYLVYRWQRSNAVQMFKIEVQINRAALGNLLERLDALEKKISARQVDSHDLFVDMTEFDYSALGPLVNSGHLYQVLGPDLISRYYKMSSFCGNNHARFLSEQLVSEHDRGKSLDLLKYLKGKLLEHQKTLQEVEALK